MQLTVVIDDLLLLRCLAGRPPQSIISDLSQGDVFTTTYWYFRLGRAVVSGSGAGALSGQMAQLDSETREHVRSSLDVLPSNIGLVPPRFSVPLMFTLRVRRQPNILAAEALAVALSINGRLAVATEAPLIHSGAVDLGLDYELFPEM